MSTEQQYQVGDIVNGHRLGEDGSWSPVPPPPAAAPLATEPAAADEPTKTSWFRRHKFLTAAVAVVAVVGVVNMAGGGESPDQSTAPESAAADAKSDEAGDASPEDAAEPVAGIGSAVQDGDFEFVVKDVETGVSSVGSEYLNAEAQGEFTIVTLAVENIGDEPQTFLDSNIVGFDSQGREVSPDTEAGLYANEEADNLLEEVNPGNSLTVKVVFDLSSGETLQTVELHDSLLSGGVEVSLA